MDHYCLDETGTDLQPWEGVSSSPPPAALSSVSCPQLLGAGTAYTPEWTNHRALFPSGGRDKSVFR